MTCDSQSQRAGMPCQIGSCRRHQACMYTPCRSVKAESHSAENVWDTLLQHALAVNDALRFHPDCVEYTGSTNLAEDFRRAVNEAWHVRSG